MFELLTTDAFAEWFSTLAPRPTEDVAATLEVIVQLGTRAEAPDSSEWLLWYEHPSLSQRLPDPWRPTPPELARFAHEWGRFYGYVKRVLKHLESKPFLARFAHLPPGHAAAVATALGRIRLIAKTRALAMSELHVKRRLFVRELPNARDAAAFESLADVSEVREAYFAALAAAGFEVADVPSSSPALREISLRSSVPGLRLLYGIDEPRNRGLVVLGEWLDRSFYGDSVRRAEALWRKFLEGLPITSQPAGGR